jgi:hypothetical protein
MKHAALFLAAVACSSAPSTPEQKLNRFGRPVKLGIIVPPWVDNAPESGKGKLFAVGFSSPTYWPQDALNNAAENARGRLGLAMTSHVEFLGMDTASATSQGGAIVNKTATDVVMQNSRIEANWVDENGDRGAPGSVWALVSILTDPAARYGGKAPSATGAVWSIGDRSLSPSWLDKLPGSATRMFAAGYSGPTYRSEDALQYAGENAIDNLVSSLRAHVQAYTLLVENASGLSVDDFARSENADDAFREIVKKSAKIEATWADPDGVRPGDPPGAVWALASIEVQSSTGGAKAIENKDLGPALDNKGNVPAEPK